jgi:hypothetical protein
MATKRLWIFIQVDPTRSVRGLNPGAATLLAAGDTAVVLSVIDNLVKGAAGMPQTEHHGLPRTPAGSLRCCLKQKRRY